jgi:PleD family two-component response regulator
LWQKQIRNPPRKNNGGINHAEATTTERNTAVKPFQTEYHLRKVTVTVSIGLAKHVSDEGPATYINRADRHLYAAKIDFLVPNKHCFGA